MSDEWKKTGPGTNDKGFVHERKAPIKSLDRWVHESLKQYNYTGYGFKEVLLIFKVFYNIKIW